MGRVYSFKSRDPSGFTRDNLFYPSAYHGDYPYGRIRVFPHAIVAPKAGGTIGAAVRDRHHGTHGEFWYCDLLGFAQTESIEGGHTFRPTSIDAQSYLAAQYMHQCGGEMLRRYHATLFGRGGPVHVHCGVCLAA